MKSISNLSQSFGFFACVAMMNSAYGQFTGPSTKSTPYVQPTATGFEVTSLLTVDNTGATADDTVPKVGGGTYGMNGIPDGLGAFDNGDGTFTLLMNHELGTDANSNPLGVTRDHGAKGAYVSKWIINKSTLAVVSGEDLMKEVYGWNASTQQSNTTTSTIVFSRFCSADLPKVTAFYNAATGLGTQERIFMHGEEGGSTGYQVGTVATGANKGKSYVLGKFNLTTNNSGLTGVGGWENALANPYPQDRTVVVGNNDGGTGIMNNAVSVYVGTKQSTGSEVDKAGLTNGTLSHILVTGNAKEITNNSTRTTSITNGTTFTLSTTASTTFSRPEDGAWNPANLNQFYFVTTDQLDKASDNLGSQIGQTRLWRLTFSDITNPSLGGTIDLIIDGQTVGGEKVNMFDNLTVNESTGHIMLQEDVGGAAHNGKVWDFDPSTFTGTTNSGTLKKVLKHDVARFGDASTSATAPFNNDEESSGIIDITSIMSGGLKHKGITNEAWYIAVDQAHYTSSTSGSTITTAQVEGGQLFLLHDISSSAANIAIARGGIVRDRLTGKYTQKVTITNSSASTIAGPFSVAIDALSTNASLSNRSGNTSSGSYINIPGASQLAAGASASVTLQFANPTNAAINYTTRINIVAP